MTEQKHPFAPNRDTHSRTIGMSTTDTRNTDTLRVTSRWTEFTDLGAAYGAAHHAVERLQDRLPSPHHGSGAVRSLQSHKVEQRIRFRGALPS